MYYHFTFLFAKASPEQTFSLTHALYLSVTLLGYGPASPYVFWTLFIFVICLRLIYNSLFQWFSGDEWDTRPLLRITRSHLSRVSRSPLLQSRITRSPLPLYSRSSLLQQESQDYLCLSRQKSKVKIRCFRK